MCSRTLVALALGGAAVALPFALVAALLYFPRTLLPANTTPEKHGLREYHGLTFPAVDDPTLKIFARLFPPQEGASSIGSDAHPIVICVHGHASNHARELGTEKSVLHKAVRPLVAGGFAVLAIDLRNHGRSGRKLPITFGHLERLDVLSAVKWILDNASKYDLDVDRIGVWGESMGGATSLLAVTDVANPLSSHIRALAVDSAFASLSLVLPEWVADKVGVVLAEDTLVAMFNSVSSLKADQVCVLKALERAKHIGGPSRASVSADGRNPSGRDGSSRNDGDGSDGSDAVVEDSKTDTNATLAENERSAADTARRKNALPSQQGHSLITTPILIVHGTSDGTVAFRHSEILTNAFEEYFEHLGVDPSAMIEHFVHEGGHVRAYEHEDYHRRLVAFFWGRLK